MSSDLFHIVVYVLAGGILGAGIILIVGRLVPGMVDRLTPNIDEQKEIVRGNQAAAILMSSSAGRRSTRRKRRH